MDKVLDRNGDENGQRKRLGLTSWVEDARERLFKRMQDAGWSSLLAICPQHIESAFGDCFSLPPPSL